MSALVVPQSPLARTEADLVGAVRDGDDRAFGELYARYGGGVLGYVRGIVRDRGRAEDIAQDVFVSALRALRGSDRAIAFKSWIYEIARNACIDEFRRAKRCPEVSAEAEADVGSRELAATTHSPETYLERRQQLDALRGAFSGLSESQHRVLVQRELEGRSYAEIAAQLGMSVPMVESTLFRARRRLGEEYDDIASGRRCEQVLALIDDGGDARLRTMGLRERRRLARHIAHCQPCRRQAHLAGIDDSALQLPSVAKKIAALFPFPFVPWRTLFRGRLSQLARSLHRAGQIADPGIAAGAGQTALAVMATAIVVSGGAGGAAGLGARPAADVYKVAPTHVQAARAQSSSAPAGALTQRSRLPASVHQAGRAALRSRHTALRASQSRSKLHVSTPPPASYPQAPPPSGPSIASPKTPSTPRLPSPPGNPLKTVRKDIGPLLHKVTAPVKRTIDKILPPPLKKLIRLP